LSGRTLEAGEKPRSDIQKAEDGTGINGGATGGAEIKNADPYNYPKNGTCPRVRHRRMNSDKTGDNTDEGCDKNV